MRSFLMTVLALACLAAGLAGAAAAPPDFAGTWIGRTEVPEAGTDVLTLVIQKKGDVYSAVFSDTLGYLVPGTEMKEIKADGNDLTFQFVIADGTLLSGKLTLKDGGLIGFWQHPGGDTAEMKFERKK